MFFLSSNFVAAAGHIYIYTYTISWLLRVILCIYLHLDLRKKKSKIYGKVKLFLGLFFTRGNFTLVFLHSYVFEKDCNSQERLVISLKYSWVQTFATRSIIFYRMNLTFIHLKESREPITPNRDAVRYGASVKCAVYST